MADTPKTVISFLFVLTQLLEDILPNVLRLGDVQFDPLHLVGERSAGARVEFRREQSW